MVFNNFWAIFGEIALTSRATSLINASGTWIYQFLNGDSRDLSARKLSGKPSELIPRGGLKGLNRSGHSVGTMLENHLLGFLLTKNEFLTIECPESSLTEAGGLNDANLVVGDCFDESTQTFRSFLFDPATREIELFDPDNMPCWSGSGATGINNAGAIVGGCAEWGYFRGTTGVFQEIRVPGATFTLPFSLNTNGHSTGITCTPERCSCFVRNYYSGAFELFNVPGSQLTSCHVITDAGDLGGWYLDAQWNQHGFVAQRKK